MKKIFCVIIIMISLINIFSSITYGRDESEYQYVKEIHNLLVIGVDNDDNMKLNSTMILTIDGIKRELRLSTIDVNDFIEVENKYIKISDCYEYNRESYFEENLEKAFDININSHIVIDKIAIEKIVEAIDGIVINNEEYNSSKISEVFITNSEKSQSKVIQGIIDKLAIISFTEYPKIIFNTFDYVILNMNFYDMMSLAFTVLSFDGYKAKEQIVKSTEGLDNNKSKIEYIDCNEIIKLKKFIYGKK